MCIDATEESGTMGRLINHGAPGNLLTKVYKRNGTKPCIGFVAARDISPGEELLYDYGDRRPHVVKALPWLKTKPDHIKGKGRAKLRSQVPVKNSVKSEPIMCRIPLKNINLKEIFEHIFDESPKKEEKSDKETHQAKEDTSGSGFRKRKIGKEVTPLEVVAPHSPSLNNFLKLCFESRNAVILEPYTLEDFKTRKESFEMSKQLTALCKIVKDCLEHKQETSLLPKIETGSNLDYHEEGNDETSLLPNIETAFNVDSHEDRNDEPFKFSSTIQFQNCGDEKNQKEVGKSFTPDYDENLQETSKFASRFQFLNSGNAVQQVKVEKCPTPDDDGNLQETSKFSSRFQFQNCGDEKNQKEVGKSSTPDYDENLQETSKFASKFQFLKSGNAVKQVMVEKCPTPDNDGNLQEPSQFASRFQFLESGDEKRQKEVGKCSKPVNDGNLQEPSKFTKEMNFSNSCGDRRRKKPRNDGCGFLEAQQLSAKGKSSVRRVIAIIAENSSVPFGVDLLLNKDNVISAVESMNIGGKTMLMYFVWVTRVLKEMALAKYPGAHECAKALKTYKDTNYQHFAKSTSERMSSKARKEFVTVHKEDFENLLEEARTAMAGLERPIKILKGTSLAKTWTRLVGFLCLWCQEEIGHQHAGTITRGDVFSTKRSGVFYSIFLEEKEFKISERLNKALVKYADVRQWRLPNNNVFFVGVDGNSFKPTELARYVPKPA